MKDKKKTMSEQKDYRIVALQRGFVAVGEFSRAGGYATIKNGAFIRRWGTSKGLGELKGGPTAQTQLDPFEAIEHHEGVIIFSMPVDAAKWQTALSE